MRALRLLAAPALLAAALLAAAAARAQDDDVETFSDRTLSPAYHRCLGRNPSTAQTGQCLEAEDARQEAWLNAAYRARMASLAPARRDALRAAERAWIRDRDRRCEKAYQAMEGGTGAGPARLTCRTSLAAARTKWIRSFR